MTTEPWLSVSEAARAIGITRQAVHQRIQAGTIDARKEPTTRTARGYFWAVNPASVEVIRTFRDARLAYAESMQQARTTEEVPKALHA